ncbi:MAG TPA: ribbon-helix-helix protein, CopG family, partial [Candidatus Binatia bacterium]
MSKVSRFGVSLEDDLLRSFDRSIAEMGYANRSEAIRDLIRDHLIQKKVSQGDGDVVGVV